MYALADCNNFFVSCERVFRPELNGRPVIVLSGNDGCAVARSNEAKALGIKMGDPLFKIRDVVERNGVSVFSSNFDLYGDISRRVQAVLRNYSPAVECYSIDESFLDLAGMDLDFDAYAKEISADCWRQTAIPVSVGVAPTKTLAKIASKLCKRYPKLRGGCCMHRPQDIEKVLRSFPVEDVWGIGRQTSRRLSGMGVATAWDFASLPELTVMRLFHLPGLRTWKELRGTPCIGIGEMVEPRRSLCVSRSFAEDILSAEDLCEQMATFAVSALSKLREQRSVALQAMVFAMTNRFKEREPQALASSLCVFPDGTDDYRAFVGAAVQATREMFRPGFRYKKAGVVITKLATKDWHVPSLFIDSDAAGKESRLSSAIDAINGTYGKGTVRLGIQGDGAVRTAAGHRSPHYTTRWDDIAHASVK